MTKGARRATATRGRKAIDEVGNVYGSLTVLAKGEGIVERSGHRRVVWVCRCECGELVEKRADKLRSGAGVCVHPGAITGYNRAHWQVRKLRGPASEHRCRFCRDVAAEWAYDHADPDELVVDCPGLREHNYPYSLKVEHYVPACRSCHRRSDHAFAAHGVWTPALA